MNSLAASIALKKNLMATMWFSLIQTQGENHETYDNSTSNCVHTPKHARPGASPRIGWVRFSRCSFSGFVRVAFRGFVKCGPYVEEHWSRSASASSA